MKIVQLKYFLETVKENNITKASQKLFVSQPAVSKAISELEEEFKTQLFIRYNNQLVLTDEGHKIYELAKELIKKYDDTYEDMLGAVKKSRILKIGIPPMLGSFLTSPIIKQYTSKHPDTEIQLIELGSVANRQAIKNGDISFGLTILPLDNKIEEELEYKIIGETKLLFSVSKDNVFAKKDKISFKEVGQFPLILMKEDCLQSSIIQNEFKKVGIKPNIKIRTNQLYTIRELLINNNLGAFIFNQILERDDKIIGIPLDDNITLKIVLAYNKNKELSNISKEFINFVKEYKF